MVQKSTSTSVVISLPKLKEQQLAVYEKDKELKKTTLPKFITEDNKCSPKHLKTCALPEIPGYPVFEGTVQFDDAFPEDKEVVIACFKKGLELIEKSHIGREILQKITQSPTKIKVMLMAGNVAYYEREVKGLPVAEHPIFQDESGVDYQIAIRYGRDNPQFMAELILHELIHAIHVREIYPLVRGVKKLDDPLMKVLERKDKKIASEIKNLGCFDALDVIMLIFFDELFAKMLVDVYKYEMYGTCATYVMPYIDALLDEHAPKEGPERLKCIAGVFLKMIADGVDPDILSNIPGVTKANTLFRSDFYYKCEEDYKEICAELSKSALQNSLGLYINKHRGMLDFKGEKLQEILKAFLKINYPFYSESDAQRFTLDESIAFLLVEIESYADHFVKKNIDIDNKKMAFFTMVFLKALRESPYVKKWMSKK